MEYATECARLAAFLTDPGTRPSPVCTTEPAVVMDWSAGAPPQSLPDPPAVGIGRYLEDRAVYTTDAYAMDGDVERRTIHLGIDVFLPPGEPVAAPFDAVVVDVADRAAARDYGPVVLLEHRAPDGTAFFTLYGHLNRATIADRIPGERLRAGDSVGRIGSRDENGGWLPHLHLQLLVSHLGHGTDVWGVAPRSQLERWRILSPDPNLLLRIPGLAAAG